MSDNYFSWHDDTLQLRVYVQPQARQDENVGLYVDYLKVRITAPPIDGKANARLLKFLVRIFGVRRNQLEITAGKKARHKQLRIQDPSCLPDGLFHESKDH
jgi:uncharacterized protein (TIGR00251 family)